MPFLRPCSCAGVRDYLIHNGDNQVITGGSAFNIKSKSLRPGNFSHDHVATLYAQHTEETRQAFESGVIDYVWYSGPWMKPRVFYGPVQRVVIELKLLHESLTVTIKEGLMQTTDYMDRVGAEEGYLIVFDRTRRYLGKKRSWFGKSSMENSGSECEGCNSFCLALPTLFDTGRGEQIPLSRRGGPYRSTVDTAPGKATGAPWRPCPGSAAKRPDTGRSGHQLFSVFELTNDRIEVLGFALNPVHY